MGPMSSGFRGIVEGEGVLHNTIYQFATYLLNGERKITFKIRCNGRLAEFHALAGAARAAENARELNHRTSIDAARRAWAYAAAA